MSQTELTRFYSSSGDSAKGLQTLNKSKNNFELVCLSNILAEEKKSRKGKRKSSEASDTSKEKEPALDKSQTKTQTAVTPKTPHKPVPAKTPKAPSKSEPPKKNVIQRKPQVEIVNLSLVLKSRTKAVKQAHGL